MFGVSPHSSPVWPGEGERVGSQPRLRWKKKQRESEKPSSLVQVRR